METWEGGHVNAFIPIFLNFLRGMETPLVVSRPPGPLLFLNFLRGMETDPVRQPAELPRDPS